MEKVRTFAVAFMNVVEWPFSDLQLALAQAAATEQLSRKLVFLESGAGKTTVAALIIAFEAAKKICNQSRIEELVYMR